ncbi:hypothetical protein AB4370_17015 [Vibrio cyclitrophicus]
MTTKLPDSETLYYWSSEIESLDECLGKDVEFKEGGKLSDLVPTMLSLTGTAIPAEMPGDVIVK